MKSMTHSSKGILATLCAVTLMGGATMVARAENPASERGTIKNIDSAAKTLTVKERHSQTERIFVWNDATKFLEKDHRFSQSHPATANDLKQGEQVHITYQKEDSLMVAKTVVITPEHSRTATGKQS